jgi:hypothetical protein
VYTDLSAGACKTVKADAPGEGNSSAQRCPGVAGYHLLVLDDDSRQTVTVVGPAGKEHPLDLWLTASGAFSSVGRRAEWRVRRSGAKDEPFALVVRYDYAASPDNPDKNVSSLVVAKITSGGVCVTDKILPAPNQNLLAREAADSSARKPCLRLE